MRLTLTDSVATLVRSAPVTVDSTPPELTRRLGAHHALPALGGRASVTLVVGDRRFTSNRRAGPIQFWLKKRPFAYRVVVTDAAGNRFAQLYRTR